jgi:hypothetical protein
MEVYYKRDLQAQRYKLTRENNISEQTEEYGEKQYGNYHAEIFCGNQFLVISTATTGLLIWGRLLW